MGSRAGLAAVFSALLVTGVASAAPDASNLDLNLLAGNTRSDVVIVPSGQTKTVASLHFKAGITVENVGPDVAQTVRVRLHLPNGLHWGTDFPDPSENCTSTANTADCASPYPLDPNDLNKRSTGWGWDITADAPGDYPISGEVTESSSTDPDTSDNAATSTVHVTPAVTVGRVKVSPAKPTAGSLVTARVLVTAGETKVVPEGVSCAGKIGRVKLIGRPGSSEGTARCGFRTPHSAAGRILRGTIGFTANDTKIKRAFAVKLR